MLIAPLVEKTNNEYSANFYAPIYPAESHQSRYVQFTRTIKTYLDTIFSNIQTQINTYRENNSSYDMYGRPKKVVFKAETLTQEERTQIFIKSDRLNALSFVSRIFSIISAAFAFIALMVYHVVAGPDSYPKNEILGKKLGKIIVLYSATACIFGLLSHLTSDTETKRKARVLKSKNFTYFIEKYDLKNHYNIVDAKLHQIYTDWRNQIFALAKNYELN